jgi:hypothetical protein
MDASQMEVMFGPVLLRLKEPIEWAGCEGDERARLRTVIEFGIVRNFFRPNYDTPKFKSVLTRAVIEKRLHVMAEMLDDGRLTATTYLERQEQDPDGGDLFVAGLCPGQEEKVTWPGECECCGDGCAVEVEAHDPLRLDEGCWEFAALEFLQRMAEEEDDSDRISEIDAVLIPITVYLDSEDHPACPWCEEASKDRDRESSPEAALKLAEIEEVLANRQSAPRREGRSRLATR